MSNRLRSYVRRTLIEKARDYNGGKRRTKESTRAACQDAMRGTDTGWWNDLIYTVDILARFNRNRTEVAEVIREFMGETGAEMSQQVRQGEKITFADLIASTGRRHTMKDYTGDPKVSDWRQQLRYEEADTACLALRFAVEYLAGEIIREICPELHWCE